MARHTTGQAKVLSDIQQKSVMAVLDTARDRAMFLLSVKAALRAVEIAGLQWRHWRGDVLELTSDITKGAKPRAVNIGEALQDALATLKSETPDARDNDPVFPNRHMKGHPMTANAVAQWFRHLYRVRMGWEGYLSHSGRRTAITKAGRLVSRVGGSLRDVQDLAGHASLKTTQIYIEASADAKKKLADML